MLKRRATMAAVPAVALCCLFTGPGCGERRARRLVTTSPAVEELPEGAVLLEPANARSVTPPMVARIDPARSGRQVLVVPDGEGSRNESGCAEFSMGVVAGGVYHSWVRALWPDSCGNSLCLAVDGGRARRVGQDAIFSTWHWVRGGEHELGPGEHRVVVGEREDGAIFDQIVFSPDADFVPRGIVGSGRSGPTLRRFGDDFSRSPGHGSEDWIFAAGEWEIAFTLDPNRVPHQYSLVGLPDPAGGAGIALVRGPPWSGCRVRFSGLAEGESEFGVVLGDGAGASSPLLVTVKCAPDAARLLVEGPHGQETHNLGQAVRLGEWQRFEIERWASVLRVVVDGRTVLHLTDLVPRRVNVGLAVRAGEAVFDDVAVEEIVWEAELGEAHRVAWQVSRGARWYRPEANEGVSLIGRAGEISAGMPGMQMRELLLEQLSGTCAVAARGLAEDAQVGALRRFLRDPAAGAPSSHFSLRPAGGKLDVGRLCVRYGDDVRDVFRFGPYHFSRSAVEDPSDYLDFTPEEYGEITSSPDVDKLRRRRKYVKLVGRGERGVWLEQSGDWRVSNGVLRGNGPEAELRFYHEIVSDMEIRLRMRFGDVDSMAEVAVYAGYEPGATVRFDGRAGRRDGAAGPADAWHSVAIAAHGRELDVRVDGRTWREEIRARGLDGGVLLRVPAGSVQFDDVEVVVPRRCPRGGYYAFDRRETDWWRGHGGAGGSARWIDHGGVACVLASHWISLIGPGGRGMLWNKREFGPDTVVGFTVEENTEWFGWTHSPSHVHHPMDNVCASLGVRGTPGAGYRLEVNTRDRSRTLLCRNGTVVASVMQNYAFPMRYVGSHQPYAPRRSRIMLGKQGGLISARVNGVEVLRYADPEPIAVNTVGVGAYDARVNFSHIEVRDVSTDTRRNDGR